MGTYGSFIRKCLEIEEKIKNVRSTEAPGGVDWIQSLPASVKTEKMEIKSEVNEHEYEFVETKPTAVKYEGEEMFIKTESIEILKESNEDGLENRYVTSNCCGSN